MKQNLVILRCGRDSLHPHWLQGGWERNFDLVLCPYQEIEPEPGAFWQSAPIIGQKWNGIYQFLLQWPQWREYKYIWLPDDDLLTKAPTINRLFELSNRFEANISAPALSENSYHSHPLTMRNRSSFARAVTFIEVMMPCFHRNVLERALPSMKTTQTGFGWGLDFVWPVLVDYEKLIIFDRLEVEHTRPVGTMRDPNMHERIMWEWRRMMHYYGASGKLKTLGNYNESGTFKEADPHDFLLRYLLGYRYLIKRNPDLLKNLVDAQMQPFEKPKPMQTVALKPALNAQPNIALNKPSLMSSVWAPLAPIDHQLSTAAEGGNNGIIHGHFGFHTDIEPEPWWQVDLEYHYAISRVVLFNRLDQRERCTKLCVLGSADGMAWRIIGAKLDDALFGGADGNPHVFEFTPPAEARFVRITLIGENYLHLDEVEVYGEIIAA